MPVDLTRVVPGAVVRLASRTDRRVDGHVGIVLSLWTASGEDLEDALVRVTTPQVVEAHMDEVAEVIDVDVDTSVMVAMWRDRWVYPSDREVFVNVVHATHELVQDALSKKRGIAYAIP